jgi:hypothetical protein
LIFGAWSNVKARLPHDGHVEVVDEGNLQTLGAFVVVAVVERFDVEQHRVTVVLACLGTLKTTTKKDANHEKKQG